MAEHAADEFAERELEKARQSLADARKLNEADGSVPGVINRVYFAAFHAAQAVLSARGTLPDDEDHVPAQFAEDVVIAEETSMDDAQFLNGLRAYRKKADYEHEPVDIDLDAKVARAERFVDDMAAFC
jgi:uncharacterized protein (UPF0332 family)